jgi:LysM repeat protein
MSRSLAAALCLGLIGSAAALPHARGRCEGGAYVVMGGDTLYSIARHCRSSVAAIAQASGLADPRRIEIGQRLVIPGAAEGAAEPAKPDEAAPVPGYRIQPADTLYSLARWARVSLAALIAANPGIDPRTVEIGDAVRLPAGAADPSLLRARERGPGEPAPLRASVRTYVPLAPPAREIQPPPTSQRDRKPDDMDDPRRGPEGM